MVESYLGGRIVVDRIVDLLNVELHLKSGMLFANQHLLKMKTALAKIWLHMEQVQHRMRFLGKLIWMASMQKRKPSPCFTTKSAYFSLQQG